MHYRLFFAILISGLMITGCVEQIDLVSERELVLLVVEGGITTGQGPHNIRLTQSSRFGSALEGFTAPVRDAIVSVRDSEGRVTFFQEVDELGNYQTPVDFRATLGLEYILQIETFDGILYQSLPERVFPVSDLDEISFEYQVLPTTDPLIQTRGVEFFVEFSDPADETNFYRWINSATHTVLANPELFVDSETGAPAPKDCCNLCYRDELPDQSVQILRDNNVDGSDLRRSVAFVEDDGIRFRELYLMRVEQLSLTQDAFEFFSLLNEQLNIDGDLFDPPPATLRGNLVNLADPDEIVIGYFYASDASVDSIFVSNAELEGQALTTVIPDDCQQLPGATIERPVYWP
jgi:hypothetical protein